jgi:cystinosin
MSVVISIFKTPFELLDILYFLSFVKIAVSLLKYIPQALLNYQRKSTVGWSIENILLDFSGGVLSLAQLLIDCARNNNWTIITGNPVKFGLGFTSLVFDVLFLAQHYYLYPASADQFEVIHDEQEPLLPT